MQEEKTHGGKMDRYVEFLQEAEGMAKLPSSISLRGVRELILDFYPSSAAVETKIKAISYTPRAQALDELFADGN